MNFYAGVLVGALLVAVPVASVFFGCLLMSREPRRDQ